MNKSYTFFAVLHFHSDFRNFREFKSNIVGWEWDAGNENKKKTIPSESVHGQNWNSNVTNLTRNILLYSK
jgi:hypothetical protein